MFYRALEDLRAGDFVKFGEPNKIKKCFSNEEGCLGQLEEDVVAEKKIPAGKIKPIELAKTVTAENITILRIPPEATAGAGEELLDMLLREYKKSRAPNRPVQPDTKRTVPPNKQRKAKAKKQRSSKPRRKR